MGWDEFYSGPACSLVLQFSSLIQYRLSLHSGAEMVHIAWGNLTEFLNQLSNATPTSPHPLIGCLSITGSNLAPSPISFCLPDSSLVPIYTIRREVLLRVIKYVPCPKRPWPGLKPVCPIQNQLPWHHHNSHFNQSSVLNLRALGLTWLQPRWNLKHCLYQLSHRKQRSNLSYPLIRYL